MLIEVQKLVDGKPVPRGRVFIGQYGSDPYLNQSTAVYTDSSYTKPISAIGGIQLDYDGFPIDDNGQRVNLYTPNAYSIQLFTKYGNAIFPMWRDVQRPSGFDPDNVYDFTNGVTVNGVDYGQDYTGVFGTLNSRETYTETSIDGNVRVTSYTFVVHNTVDSFSDYRGIEIDLSLAVDGSEHTTVPYIVLDDLGNSGGVQTGVSKDALGRQVQTRLNSANASGASAENLATTDDTEANNRSAAYFTSPTPTSVIAEGVATASGASYTIKGKKTTGSEKTYLEVDAELEVLLLRNTPVYADDTAAGAGGLPTDAPYKTPTGELRIKL